VSCVDLGSCCMPPAESASEVFIGGCSNDDLRSIEDTVDTGDLGSVSSDRVLSGSGSGKLGEPDDGAPKQSLGVAEAKFRFQFATQASSIICSSIFSGGGGGRTSAINLCASALICLSHSATEASGLSFR